MTFHAGFTCRRKTSLSSRILRVLDPKPENWSRSRLAAPNGVAIGRTLDETMPRSPRALIEPRLLTWFREHAHLMVEDVARVAAVNPATVAAWEAGTSQPTIRQLRLIARKVRRPLAAFFLSEPPAGFSLPHDYRVVYGSDATIDEDLVRAVDEAHERREAALALLEDLGDDPPRFGAAIDGGQSPEELGERLRDTLRVTEADQAGWRKAEEALDAWRVAVEHLGVLIFQAGSLPDSVRGFSLSFDVLPAIVLNRKDAVVARSFTLAHEVAHLALHGDGICDPLRAPIQSRPGAETEVYCNHVAGAVLVPALALQNELPAGPPSDREIEELACRFQTSCEVLVRRLAILGVVDDEFYQRKRAEYEAARATRTTRKGRRIPMSVDVLSKVGRPFARLVLTAYRAGAVSSTDAAAHLGARLKHFPAIEAALAR